MKLSNFVLTKTEGNSILDFVFFAEVDVETGCLFWKKTERKTIIKKFAEHWFFLDSGKFIPDYQADDLSRSYAAKTGNKYL